MKRAMALMAALLLSACAATPPQEPPRVERLSPEQLAARLPQPTAIVTLEDVVAMSRAGKDAAEIVARLKDSHSRHRLSAGQILALHDKGVATAVLDYLVESERQAVFDDMAAELARRDQACLDAAQQEARACRLQCFTSCPTVPFGGCWPPRPGYPFWHCF